jgi:hypothetical protein
VSRAAGARSTRVALIVPPLGAGADPESCQALAEGAVLGGYRFDAYREKSDEVSRVAALALLVARGQNLRASREAARRGVVIAESQNAARELSNLPPNVLSPEQLAQEARAVARDVGPEGVGVRRPRARAPQDGRDPRGRRRQLAPAAPDRARVRAQGRRRSRGRSRSWARASRSTRAASRSNPRRAWTR